MAGPSAKDSAMMITIAAEFEDCMQTYSSLCSAMDANPAVWQQKIPQVQTFRVDLLNWGYVSGAATRALDYALHKSSALRKQVLELLEAINTSLHTALEIVQTAALPMLSPAVPEQPQLSYFDRRPDRRPGAGALPVTHEDLQPKLEDMLHTFGLLDRLSPALRDPPPLDIFFTGELDHTIDTDVKLVRRMFPRATDLIAERLGRANWQRRLFLRSLRSRIRQERSSADQMAVTPGTNRQFSLASPEALPSRHRLFRPELPEHHRAMLGRLNSRRTSFSDSTTDDSGFWSRAGSRVADTATSLTDSDIQGSSQLSVPPPPVPLEDGASFRCQYCGLDIVVGETCAEIRQRWLAQKSTTTARGGEVFLDSSGNTARIGDLNTPSNQEPNIALPTSLEVLTSADWVAHVFIDIEPYVCTSELCSSGSRTYGTAAKWLTHELDSHRLARIWYCQSCDQPFPQSEAFVGHLTSAHGLAADQALAVSIFCEKPAQSAPDLSCALCALTCSSFDSFRVHVAGHLEQLALCSIETDEKAESEIPTSPAIRPASADYARLEDFVSSQSKYYPSAVLQEHQLVSMEKQKLNQNTTMGPEKIIPVGQAKRPKIPGRGPSYSFLSDVRQRKAREHGAADLAPATPSGSASNVTQTVRTNSPPRNVDFVGRIDEMDNLHRQLSRVGNICVLSGIGGLGKSALAAEYTYRFERCYAYIFWVQAETPMICADTFSQIAAAAPTKGGVTLPSADEQRLVSLSQEFLEQTTDKWLLIFDNVDEKLDLRRFLPFDMTSATGSVLITTNRSSIALADTIFPLTQIDLGNLTLEESRRLLLSATPGGSHLNPQVHPEYKLAGEIAKRAERLPLALSMIAGYVMGSHCTLAEFVGLWNERRKSIRSSSQSSKGPGSDTDEAMETLWDIGLREVPSDARKLLNILAFLDPDQIQKDLLVGLHEDPILELLHASEAFRYLRMTSELKRRRLIAVETKNGQELISIHRKLQARILRDLADDPSLGQAVFNQAFALIRSRFPQASPIQVPEPEKWQTCKKYLPHVLSLQRLSIGNTIHLKFTAGLARLFSDGGIDLWERGLTTEGLSLLKSAETTLDKIDTEDFQQLRANIHVIISLLLQDSGLVNIGECHDRIKTALGIREQYKEDCDAASYSRDDEILLYNAWSDYACVLLQLNMFDEAEPIFEQCLRQYHKWGDSDAIPYEYAKGYHHTAFCLMYRGLEDQAVESAQICLINVEQATGKSAAYYRWKFDLACIMLQHSSFLQSVSWQSDTINMHKEVLEARLQLHGRFAFLTLESYYALGSALSYVGNITEAETCMRTIIEAEKTRPGSCNEVALARTHFYLSLLLLSLEEGSQASQHPTSRSEADTAIVSTSTAPERAQDRKGLLLAVPSSTVENPIPALRPSSPAQSSVVAVGAQDQQPTAPEPETRLRLEPILRESTANLRLTEAADLTQAAKKVLDKHRSQLSGAFAHLHTDSHSAEAQRFVEENPLVLYDLMQPVFDGRFAGRDVMEYLRLVKNAPVAEENPATTLGSRRVLEAGSVSTEAEINGEGAETGH